MSFGTLVDITVPRRGRKSVDLTGRRFGKLVALKFLGLRGETGARKAYWLCQCDCGNLCEYSANYLLVKNHPRTHCGCIKRPGRKPKPPSYDLTGQVFSELTVLGYAGKDKIGNHCWKCKCSCGEVCTASTTALRTGNKQSCGHLYMVKNKIYIIGDVGICFISNGEYFWFDAEDIELVESHQWSTQGGYAYTHCYDTEKPTTHRLIRMLFGLPPSSKKPFIDHINGDIRDNRRSNLRLCTPAENVRHRREVRGWHPAKDSQRYFSRITVNGKIVHLGTFDTKEAARNAYLAASKKYHGAFGAYERIVWFPGCEADREAEVRHVRLLDWVNFLADFASDTGLSKTV